MMKKQLLEMIKGQILKRAPVKTERFGIHWSFTIEIDANHTAELTMTDEAYEALIGESKDPNQKEFQLTRP